MKYPTLDQADLEGKKVLLRAGFDVPIKDGEVTDTTRIEAIVDTMRHIRDQGAALIVMAHQSRPEANRVPEMSQKPLVPVLEKLLGVSVQFADYCVSEETQTMADNLQAGEVMLLENLRYEAGEKSEDLAERDAFGEKLASLVGKDGVYINDAFTNCHRDHASMTSVPKFTAEKYIGFNVQKEIEGIGIATENPEHPVLLAISGAKAKTKVPIVEGFMQYGDNVILGGCVANTFMAANHSMGFSKYDKDWVSKAEELIAKGASDDTATVHVPIDGVTTRVPPGESQWRPTADSPAENVAVADIEADMSVLDVGEQTVERYINLVRQAKTIIWNGPLGYSELPQFAQSSKKLADAIAEATKNGAKSVLGGGDTLKFLNDYGYTHDRFTYVSTAGGAMLQFVAGEKLPALEALL